VRELKNVVARRIALGAFADTGTSAEALPAATGDVIDKVLGMDLPLVEARARVVTELESRYLTRVLDQHGGNVSRAAAASGIARRYFQLIRARVAPRK
jgi:DNA-binding NtrC family response regulator